MSERQPPPAPANGHGNGHSDSHANGGGPAGAGSPRRGPRRGHRAALALAGLSAVVAAGAWTAWHTEAGTRWALTHLPGVTAHGVQGTLARDLQVAQLQVDAGGVRVAVDALRLQGLALHPWPGAGRWLGVHADRLSADHVRIARTAAPAAPATATAPPASLRLPVSLDLPFVAIGRLAAPGLPALQHLRAGVALGAEGGRVHRIDDLAFAWERVQARGELSIGADAPLRVEARLSAHNAAALSDAPRAEQAPDTPQTAAALPWTATAALLGPLDRMDATLALRGVARPGHPTPEVDAQARVQPFAPAPLTGVSMRTQAFDLASLSAGAPSTRLDGHVDLASTQPLAADVDLRNLAPAPWSAGGVPAASLQARVEAAWDDHPVTVPSLRLALDDGHGAAGLVTGEGQWSRDAASARLALQGVALSRLDARLAALVLGGQVNVQASGLSAAAAAPAIAPTPRGAARPGASAAAAASGALPPVPPAAGARAGNDGAPGWRLRLDADLHGPLTGARGAAPRTATLAVQAQASATEVVVSRAELAAGPSRVAAQGRLSRAHVGDDWHGEATARVSAFDPAAWWHAPAAARAGAATPAAASARASQDTAARTGPQAASPPQGDAPPAGGGGTRLDGRLDVQVERLPAHWQGFAALRARATATLAGSRVAGTAIDGRATLDATGDPWRASGELHGGRNVVRWDATASPGARGPADHARVEVDAPDLSQLVPLAAPWPALLAHWPTRGAAHATLVAGGSRLLADAARDRPADFVPPALVVDSRGEVADLATPDGTVGRLQWRWQGGPGAATPLAGHVAVEDARAAGGRLASVTLDATGTTGAHEIRATALAPVQPPAWLARMAALPEGAGTRLDLRAQGRWGRDTDLSGLPVPPAADGPGARTRGAREPAAGPRWRVHLASLTLRAAAAARVSGVSGVGGAVGPGSAGGGAADGTGQAATATDRGRDPAGALDAAEPGAAQRSASASASASALAVPVSVPEAEADAAPALPGRPWLTMQPVDAAVAFDAGGALATVRVAAGSATVAGLPVTWSPGWWAAGPAGRPGRLALDGRIEPVAVAPLLARLQPDLGWQGDLAVEARWHVVHDGGWTLSAALARTAGDLALRQGLPGAADTSQALGLTAAAVGLEAEGGRWHAHAAIAGRQLGRLDAAFDTSAPPAAWPGADAPLTGRVEADVSNLTAWGRWLPPGWRLGGGVRADVAVAGRLGAPALTGTLTGRDLVVRNALEGVYGHDGTFSLRLAGDEATLDHFTLKAGTGVLEASGHAVLGARPSARVDLQASHFQALGRLDRRLVVSGTAQATFTVDALDLGGTLTVDEGLFDLSRGNAPTLDADVQVAGAESGVGDEAGSDAGAGAAGAPAAGAGKRRSLLALDVDLGDHLRVKGRGVDTRLAGKVRLSAPGGRLSMQGQVRALDGQYTAYGQKLDIQRGEITFTGPVADPTLDVRAIRRNIDIVVGVAITGTALQPHVQLFSEPEMADIDKLSWLMLGRAPETLGSADTGLLQSAALALFSGEGESPTDALLHRIGLTDFSVRQGAASGATSGSANVSDTIVSLGRQLSKRWYMGYERDINNATGNWQLVYRIAQRVTVRVQSGYDSALDVIWAWRWN